MSDIPATHFRCISCGHTTDPLTERKFRCEKCDNLFDAVTDYQAHPLQLQRGDLRRLFNGRATPGQEPTNRSGVWRFVELIWPELANEDIVTLGEGIIPIVPAGHNLREWIGGELDLHIILEGQNPSGSFKCMGMTALMTLASLAKASGVTCASTGDTSAALAAYAAAAGIPCTVLLPLDKVTASQLTQPVYYGARVLGIPGDFDDCMEIQLALVERFGAYPGNSLNPMRIAGHMATVFLLAQYFDWELPDWIAAPVGNGSNVSSIGLGMKRLRELNLVGRSAYILGCQTERANPLARSWQPGYEAWESAYAPVKAGDTIATATQIGSPVSWKKVVREVTYSSGEMATASESDIRAGMSACLRDGVPVCPQTGIAIAGLREAVRSASVKPGSRVAIVSTATTLKFTEVFRDDVTKAVERMPDTTVESVAKALRL